MRVDGLYHVLAFVRINYNPVLVGSLRDRDWDGARKTLQQTKKYVYPGAAAVSFFIVAVFWVLTEVFVPGKGLGQGLVPLSILLAGLTLIAAFIPFDNLMLVGGHPGLQTLQHMTLVLTNITLNLALIPLLGIQERGLPRPSATSAVSPHCLFSRTGSSDRSVRDQHRCASNCEPAARDENQTIMTGRSKQFGFKLRQLYTVLNDFLRAYSELFFP